MERDPRYVAVRFPGASGVALGRLFADEPGMFVWGCYDEIPRRRRMVADAEIVHDYPWVDPDDDAGLDAIYLAYLRQFEVMTPTPLETLDGVPCGWVAPDGALVACSYHEHDSIADAILATRYNRLGNGAAALEALGWLRLESSGNVLQFSRGFREMTWTPAQVDVLITIATRPDLSLDYQETLMLALETATVQAIIYKEHVMTCGDLTAWAAYMLTLRDANGVALLDPSTLPGQAAYVAARDLVTAGQVAYATGETLEPMCAAAEQAAVVLATWAAAVRAAHCMEPPAPAPADPAPTS